jgi:hypothetical protein
MVWYSWKFGILCTVCGLLFMGAAAVAEPRASNKWRIECSGNAESAGEIVFRITPVQGTPMEVVASIKRRRSENGVARDIRDALQAQLPAERFGAETDDGEDVLLKKHRGQPDFLLELVSSTVKGARFNLDRE